MKQLTSLFYLICLYLSQTMQMKIKLFSSQNRAEKKYITFLLVYDSS